MSVFTQSGSIAAGHGYEMLTVNLHMAPTLSIRLCLACINPASLLLVVTFLKGYPNVRCT